MAVIPRFTPSNGTRESGLAIPAGRVLILFLWTAETQSGFDEEQGRIQCDHKPITWRNRLDFWWNLRVPRGCVLSYADWRCRVFVMGQEVRFYISHPTEKGKMERMFALSPV